MLSSFASILGIIYSHLTNVHFCFYFCTKLNYTTEWSTENVRPVL